MTPDEYANLCGWGQHEADCIRGRLAVETLYAVACSIIIDAGLAVVMTPNDMMEYIPKFLAQHPEVPL